MTTAESLIADIETEAAYTRKLLAAVPEERFSWKPHERSMSLGTLAGHLAENPSWTSSMLEDEMDFGQMKDYVPFVPGSRAELTATFERNLADCIAALRGRSDELLATSWTMKMDGRVIQSTPKRDVIRSITLHHQIHHRGQLSVYLRLLGVPLPKTYGPTADDPSFP